jgi:hypothetical protein
MQQYETPVETSIEKQASFVEASIGKHASMASI